jgi:hypothetical protein
MVSGTPCPITALPSERQPSSDLRDTVAIKGKACQAMSSLGTANRLLRRCGLPGFLDSLDELQPVVFVALLQRMLSREFESEFVRPSAHAHAHMHTSELMHTRDGALSLSLSPLVTDRQREQVRFNDHSCWVVWGLRVRSDPAFVRVSLSLSPELHDSMLAS